MQKPEEGTESGRKEIQRDGRGGTVTDAQKYMLMILLQFNLFIIFGD